MTHSHTWIWNAQKKKETLSNKVIFIMATKMVAAWSAEWTMHFITTSHRFKCAFLKWVIPLDFWAWRLSLFLWALPSAVAENVSATFGFICLEQGEIFWKKIRKQAEATSKDWNNSKIKLNCHSVNIVGCFTFRIKCRESSNMRKHFQTHTREMKIWCVTEYFWPIWSWS